MIDLSKGRPGSELEHCSLRLCWWMTGFALAGLGQLAGGTSGAIAFQQALKTFWGREIRLQQDHLAHA